MAEEKKVALFLCQAKNTVVASQELDPLPWGTGRGLVCRACGRGLVIWIKAVKGLPPADGLMVR